MQRCLITEVQVQLIVPKFTLKNYRAVFTTALITKLIVNMRRSVFLFMLLLPLVLHSQNFRVCHGFVTDIENDRAVELANISIQNTAIGTFSNSNGEFVLNIPFEQISDNIVISCMGYQSVKILLENPYDSLKMYKVQLQPKTYQLSQAVVLPDTLNETEIMRKVVRSFGKNYPKRQFMLDIFHREVSYNTLGENLALFEAAYEVQDYGFDSDIGRCKIRLKEVRKSESYYEKSMGRLLFSKIMGQQNQLYRKLREDRIRAFNREPAFGENNSPLKRKNFKKYSYKLESLQYLDSSLVYVINYTPKESIGMLDIEGYLFINTADYAILKAEFNVIFSSKVERNLPSLGKYFSKTEVNYRKYEGKYFLSYMSDVSSMKKNDSELYFHDKNGDFQLQLDKTTIYVNNVYYTNKDFERIRRKQIEAKDGDAYKKEYTYNPAFWQNYNMVLANPTDKKVKVDLEREKKLETQFKDNAKQK